MKYLKTKTMTRTALASSQSKMVTTTQKAAQLGLNTTQGAFEK